MEMDPIPGYEIASWERGYGDFAMKPDLETLRRIPWLEATALVLADVLWHDGSPVQPSPRQVLRAQMERASALGYTPMAGSELEFYLLRETYQEAWAQRYEDLTPSVPYILDYHVLATTYDEDLIRQIRNGMHAAGIKVETSKGEAWPGQHEINFRFADALTMADNHVIYKNGAKELESNAKRFPSSLRDAIALLENGTVARAAFGDQVVDHYLNYARTEQALLDKAVTD
jgi:glutamine synthetase